MQFKKNLIIILVLAGALNLKPASLLVAEIKPGNAAVSSHYVVWVHSDIQPRNWKEKSNYPVAVKDVRNNLPRIGMAIVAGDIIQTSKNSANYEWYLETKDAAGIPYWFEIAGNHDARDLDLYYKHIKKPLHYAVYLGNVLFIFLSDEDGGLPSKISDKAFEWWRKLVVENQNKNIITVSHAPLSNSGLVIMPSFGLLSISRSSRFTQVLKQYRVPLWLSGHIHIPSSWGFNEKRKKEFNNTQFINVSRIRSDNGVDPESRFLIFTHGSRQLVIKTRDHVKEKFIDKREVIVELPYSFEYKNTPLRMIIPRLD